MQQLYRDFLQVTFPDSLNENLYSQQMRDLFSASNIRMQEIHAFVTPAIDIVIKPHNIPLSLINRLDEFIIDFLTYFESLVDLKRPEGITNINSTHEKILGFHNRFFNLNSDNHYLLLVTSILNYKEKADANITARITEQFQKVEESERKVQSLVEKLANPSAERVLSDYSKIYEAEEANANRLANRWALFGIALTFIFICVLFLSLRDFWFSPVIKLTAVNGKEFSYQEILNYPGFLTKFLISSVVLYFIFFCFKQYSIYRHLEYLFKQKKNAFDSFEIFDAALGGSSSEMRMALLSSLAQSIHESTNTGFLTSKGGDPQIKQQFDLGKLMSITSQHQ